MYIICQYFCHRDPLRAAEFEICIRENIRGGHDLILFEEQPAPEDIRKSARQCIAYPQRLTFSHAMNWAHENLPTASVVALINLDIVIRFTHTAIAEHFQQYPSHFLCLSRFEYDPESRTVGVNQRLENGFYMNCQDAWVFRTPIPLLPLADFPIGNCPGCDNAIAFRAAEAGLLPINLAGTFPIWHYDAVRSKSPDTQILKDDTTALLRPEKYGRLFLPRIPVGGGFNYHDILASAKDAAMRIVDESGYSTESDARMSSFLACQAMLRGMHLPWDAQYLLGCIALNNCVHLDNSRTC